MSGSSRAKARPDALHPGASIRSVTHAAWSWWSGRDDFHRAAARGTIVTMTSEPLRTIRDRFSEFVERVQGHHERVVVTRNGTPAAVLVSPDDLESLEETIAVLSDSEAVAELIEAHRAYVEGDVVRGSDAVRALRPR